MGVFQRDSHISGNSALRAHQRSTHAELEKLYKLPDVTSVLVCACTGSGKTGTIAMAPLAVPGCKRVLVVCPNDTIKQVLVKALNAHEFPSAFLKNKAVFQQPQSGQIDYPKVLVLEGGLGLGLPSMLVDKVLTADIVVTTALYLAYSDHGRRPRLDGMRAYNREHPDSPLFDLIVFDEAHHTPCTSWKLIRGSVAVEGSTKVLHTTATPFRSDNQRIEFDRAVRAVSLIDGLVGSPLDSSADPFVKDLCFLELQEGDNEVGEEEAAKAAREGAKYSLPDDDVMLLFRAIARQLGVMRISGIPHRALVVVGRQTGSDNRAEQIERLLGPGRRQVRLIVGDNGSNAEWMRVTALHSGVPTAERKKIMQRFQRRDISRKDTIDVLVTVDTLGEGYDFPFLSVVGVLRPYMSLAPFYQFVGRATRRITHHVIGEDDVDLTRMDNVAHIITHQRLNQRRWFELLCKYMRSNQQRELPMGGHATGAHGIQECDLDPKLAGGLDSDFESELEQRFETAVEGAGVGGVLATDTSTETGVPVTGPFTTGDDAQEAGMQLVTVMRMFMAPLSSQGGEAYRDQLVRSCEMPHCWWNTRLERSKGPKPGMRWVFKDLEQDLAEVFTEKELVVAVSVKPKKRPSKVHAQTVDGTNLAEQFDSASSPRPSAVASAGEPAPQRPRHS